MNSPEADAPDDANAPAIEPVHEPRLWRDDGWTARVIKNEDDDGWAVEMIKDGESEPALVGPWTPAFHTLVKTASEVLRRHEQQLHALLHKSVSVTVQGARITVNLDIVPDEDNAYALLSAHSALGEQLAEVRVAPTFKLSSASAEAWIEGGYLKPR